jgi:hypothetical protein
MAPRGVLPPTPQQIRGKVTAPGICLIIVGGFNLLMCLGILGMAVFQLNGRGNNDDVYFFVVLGLITFLKGVPMIYGGIQMTRMRSYRAAMTGAVVAMAPCFYCWMLELGFGIWAVVVLSDPFTRAAFEERSRAEKAETGNPFAAGDDSNSGGDA